MRLSSDVLFGLLSEKYHLERFGKGVRRQELSLPVFWQRGGEARKGSVYIAHAGDLPSRPPEDCIFICDGTRPPKVWNMWPCDVIYVTDSHEGLINIFNTVQQVLDRLISWETHMQRLQTTGASIRDLVEESIPIFDNRITVCDYELRILATCEIDEDDPEGGVRMYDKLKQVPAEHIPSMINGRTSAIRNREPYFYNTLKGKETYCINFYLGDIYIGSCSLQEQVHALAPHDLDLFQVFAEYVRGTLALQARSVGNQLVTARTVFEQLLSGYPVSQSDMNHALKLIDLNLCERGIEGHKWCCVVIQNTHNGGALPEGYLCTTVESILPNATPLVYNDSIVAYCLIKNEGHRQAEICDPLQAYLADMGFKAGISRTFLDSFHARDYYRQALATLETGFECDPDRSWYLFGDYALDYMLLRCCGEFSTEMMVPPELVRLYRRSSTDVDYIETLRTFLDNDCRITQTANVLYLHRTTMVKRLEKMREHVNLDDPDRRLYLRMCLHLPDIEQTLEACSDVS